jgi:hypothetical protein
MFMLPNWTFKIVLLMISPAARDGLTDLLDDLEFFGGCRRIDRGAGQDYPRIGGKLGSHDRGR